MKKTKILFTVLVVAILLSSMLVFAPKASAFNDATLKTGDDGQITITRNVLNVTNNVTNTFSYTIAAKTGNPATVTGYPTSAEVIFNGKAPGEGTTTATQTGIIDFSHAVFTELGDYYFTITETGSTDSNTYPLDTKKYDLVVSVRNVYGSGTTPTGTTIEYSVADQAYTYDSTNTNVTDTKADVVYQSSSPRTYIELTKNVTGNMGRTDKYFQFDIELTHQNVRVGDVINVYNASETGTYNNGSSRFSTVTVRDVDGKKVITVYAKHGETIVIGKKIDGSTETCQLPVGTKYTISETDYNSESEPYTTTIDGTADNDKISNQKTTVAVGDTNFNTANKTTYVNDRTLPALTGLFINIMPFVLLVVVAFVGIILIKKTSKKED